MMFFLSPADIDWLITEGKHAAEVIALRTSDADARVRALSVSPGSPTCSTSRETSPYRT